MSRVLVLGASGFIGRCTVRQLGQAGVTVIAASRRPVRAPPAVGILTQVLDARNEPELRRALEGATGVINCVAGDPDSLIATSKALFAAATHMRPAPRIVHLSSLAVYGSLSGAVDETVPPRGDLGPYSAVKLATEKLAADCASAVILRPGIVYGARSPWWSDRIARLLCARRLGDLGTGGEGFSNLVHVEDVAAAALRALRLPGIEGQTFNLTLSNVLCGAYPAGVSRSSNASWHRRSSSWNSPGNSRRFVVYPFLRPSGLGSCSSANIGSR